MPTLKQSETEGKAEQHACQEKMTSVTQGARGDDQSKTKEGSGNWRTNYLQAFISFSFSFKLKHNDYMII